MIILINISHFQHSAAFLRFLQFHKYFIVYVSKFDGPQNTDHLNLVRFRATLTWVVTHARKVEYAVF